MSLASCTAVAVWRIGFWTCVLLTLCMMMGEWVLAWRADQACMEDEVVREEDESMEEAGEGEGFTGTGEDETTEEEGGTRG